METTFERDFDKAVDALWEAQTKPVIDGETLRQAAKHLETAIEDVDHACDYVNEAAGELKDTVQEDRVYAMLNDMENILADLKAMKDKFEKGVTK